MQHLEKIDAIRSRFPLTYAEAGRLLSECGGDILKALDKLEQAEKNRIQRAEKHIEELLEEYARKY